MPSRHSHHARPAAAVAAAVLALAATAPHAAAADRVVSEGSFSSVGPAWTYHPLVPDGSVAVVRAVETGSGRTVATLRVRGFAPSATYDVHAHVGACGSDPAASGGHYQNQVGGAVDEVNELWLGFRTNPAGSGAAHAVVEWQFREGEARSLTFHAATGARVACLPVAF
jgi:Cu-Zn family superoxide dismutase